MRTNCIIRALSVLLVALGTVTFAQAQSQLANLMPRPVQANATGGNFTGTINSATVTKVTSSQLGTFDYTVAGFDNEGYKLSVTPAGIRITAASDFGVIRAKQTLRQLIQNVEGLDFSNLAATDAATVTIECCDITDYPAFKVRGYMHDVGRSFISYEEIKKEIDLLARFKVNMFHWHLTDNHGFRFQSFTHPDLNTKGFSRFPQGVYTQAQCKELDAYARERGVIIIPEIDMPGHSSSFEAAMNCTMYSTQGKQILKDVLDELIACFPNAPYIHIGGDETDKATIDYVNEMADHVRAQDKKTVLWNTYGPAQRNLVTPSTMHVDMVTNWATTGRLVQGIPNIDMRYFYVNHFDVFADLAGAYRSTILEAQKGNTSIGGISVGIWNDRYLGDERQIIAQNNLYATVMAIGERAWVGGTVDGHEHQYIEKCRAYLPNEGWEYDEYADWERRFLFYKDKWLANEPIPYVKSSNIRWNITKAYDNGGDKTAVFAPETTADLVPEPGSIYATGAGQWLNHIWNGNVQGVLGSQGYNQTRYAWTYVYSPKDQEVGVQIEFRNYSRSDRGLVPANKQWDLLGSRVWLNDAEILPAWDWTNAGVNPGIDTELGNLNFPGRAPIKVQLHEGWNKVLLKCPYINIGGGNGNRPNKWQYTFVFTTLDGSHAVDGLIYSPNKVLDGNEDFTAPEIPRVVPFEFSTLGDDRYYTIRDRRSLRYLNNSGAGVNMTSSTTVGKSNYWRFERRSDGTFNIISRQGGYISPASDTNTALKVDSKEPQYGWHFEYADTDGFVLFMADGNHAQMNQTTNAHSFQLYNWGYGSKTTGEYRYDDQGCHFSLAEIDYAIGDVNPNNRIETQDVTALEEVILEKVTTNKNPAGYDLDAADVYRDKRHSVADLPSLVKRLLRKK